MNRKGQIYKLKLDARRAEIHNFIQLGVSKASVARIVNVTEKTLAKFLRRNPVPEKNTKKTLEQTTT